jgi:MinD superfamily P-loop ATPase
MSYKIAVASGKGGTGKTTVATNLYRLINGQPAGEAMLVDCDVEEPNDILFFPDYSMVHQSEVIQEVPAINPTKCTFCRKCVDYCEFNAIVVIPPVKFAEINPSLCHSCGACQVACESDAILINDHPIGTITHFKDEIGNGILEGRLKIGSPMQTMVIRSLKRKVPAGNAVIILDAPPGTSCPVVETISDADFVILVTEPTPFGLHDLKLMINLVKEIEKPFGVVVNKANLGNQDIYEFLESEEIELMAEIPFNRSYASQYAKADLFSEVPEEINLAYGKLLQTLSLKKLIS